MPASLESLLPLLAPDPFTAAVAAVRILNAMGLAPADPDAVAASARETAPNFAVGRHFDVMALAAQMAPTLDAAAFAALAAERKTAIVVELSAPFVIDRSGSIPDAQINAFLAEIRSIQAAFTGRTSRPLTRPHAAFVAAENRKKLRGRPARR